MNMIELVHTLTGGIIAYKISSPFVSLPLAFVSHFVLDLLPHWNPHLHEEKKKFGQITKKTLLFVFSECFLALILGTKLAASVLPDTGRYLTIILGCFFAILPDLIEAPYYFYNKKNQLIKKLITFQGEHQWNVPFVFGIFSQLIYLSLLFYFAAIL